MNFKKKVAVLLFNFGGPSCLNNVRQFLFSLFSDPNIISLKQPFRFLLAIYISFFRSKNTKKLYKLIGGKSPILDLSYKQASALREKLKETENSNNINYKVFVAMQYSYPRLDDIKQDIEEFSPDEITVLPLYPQYSSTTTLSFLSKNIHKLEVISHKTNIICCYHTHELYILSLSKKIRNSYKQALEFGKPRMLFSAHGIPEYMVNNGDPYQRHVNQTAEALVAELGISELDWKVCYQSKVGRLKWLVPSTEDEIKKTNIDNIPVVVVPISFVSENLETLVELDIEYQKYAKHYFRVPTVGIDNDFISALTDLIIEKRCDTKCLIENKLCWKQYTKQI